MIRLFFILLIQKIYLFIIFRKILFANMLDCFFITLPNYNTSIFQIIDTIIPYLVIHFFKSLKNRICCFCVLLFCTRKLFNISHIPLLVKLFLIIFLQRFKLFIVMLIILLDFFIFRVFFFHRSRIHFIIMIQSSCCLFKMLFLNSIK